MRNWHLKARDTQDVAVLLFPRFSNHCLANAIEPLRAANELLMRDFYRWTFVSLDGKEVTSSSGMPVLPNSRLRDHPGGAFLFVMSSYDVRTFATPRTSRALTAAALRYDTIVGMDTGAWLMAEAGILDGKTATIHWNELTAFSEKFGAVDAVAERFVNDGSRSTCGGAMTTFDFILDLIGRTHGEALRLEVSAFFLHQPNMSASEEILGGQKSSLIETSVSLMSSEIETPLPIGDIAKRLGTTQRVLARTFQAELGAPPKTVYKRLRLASARRYAEQSSYSIAEIALRCGYANAASMTRAFVEQYGKPPSAFRAKNQRDNRSIVSAAGNLEENAQSAGSRSL